LPKVKTVIWRSIPDNNTRFAEFQAGTVDMADLAQTDAATLEGNADFVKTVIPSLSVGYIAFNQAMKPFDKLEVRQAIAHAVNWDALVTTFYGDYAKRAAGFQPPAILGHNPELKPYEYSPDKAKELLTKAGLPDGFTTDFWYIPVVRGYFPDSKALSEAMAADLAKVGIKLNLQTKDWGAYLTDRKDGKFPMWALGWGSDNGDPDNFIGYHFIWSDPTKPNIEDSYNNPKLQELLQQGRVEPDAAKREKIYQQAEQIVYDDVARIPVAWPEGITFNHAYLKGYRPLVFRDQLEYLSVEK
jgi:peptide/nickel transport system substrate-binding protein